MPVKPLPCPFCGGIDIEVSREASTSDMVKCYGCGAKIALYWPDDWPDGTKTLQEVEAWNQARCLERWNRRSA